jgi:hypothetical protein
MQIWQRTGVQLVRPATAHEIKAVMDQIGQPASADVMQLYEFTGGFAGGTDEHSWALWDLQHIRRENTAMKRPQWRFSDGLMDSFYFCFKYQNEEVSSVWIDHCEDEIYPIAGSLAEFFHLYLSDPGSLSLV